MVADQEDPAVERARRLVSTGEKAGSAGSTFTRAVRSIRRPLLDRLGETMDVRPNSGLKSTARKKFRLDATATPAAASARARSRPFAALVAGAVAMGASPIFVRLADVGPFASAFWRVALALPLLYAWMRLAEAAPRRRRRRFSRAAILSGLAFSGDLFFWHLADRAYERRQRDLLRHDARRSGSCCSAGSCFASG